jgi:hypothetical protein
VRRVGSLLLLSALLLATLPLTASAQVPPAPPRDQWYASNEAQVGKGHWSDGDYVRIDKACLGLPEPEAVACSLEAFKAKPFTVIAFVDSGINPYHQDFRAPDFVHHPSAFIEGFPAAAEAVDLSFDVADAAGYDAARDADTDLLAGLARNRLYWFPGTRIIGGYSTRAGGNTAGFPAAPTGREEYAVIDDQGHGTGVASVAAGRYFGSDPNALIVMVEGLGEASLNWATSQPWIDIVSNSWGNVGNLPLGSTTATRNATRRGQSVLFAAGNGTTNRNSHEIFGPIVPVEDPCKCKFPDSNPSFTSPYGGPSWILTVGAASPVNGQAHWWHSIPVDVSSFGSKWRAASAFGVSLDHTRDFGGTSCATPITAGVLSSLITRARDVFADAAGGQRSNQAVALAQPGADVPATGPLADGALTRVEAEELVQKNAFPVELAKPEQLTWDYAVRPTTRLYYAYQGYGVVNNAAKARAHEVLLGGSPMPDRPEVDAWLARVDAARNAVWGNP